MTLLLHPSKPFLTAQWHHIVMLNYEVAPEILQPYVLPGLQLDLWERKAYVTLVGLYFVVKEFFGYQLPFFPPYEQVNLRLYVRKKFNGQSRRGVVFIKEIVPGHIVSAVARLFFKQNCRAHPMEHTFKAASSDGAAQEKVIEYAWQHSKKWEKLRIRSKGKFELPSEGSKEEFVVERYWGYASQRCKIKEFHVEHPPWKIQHVCDASLECDVGRLYGPEFMEYLHRKPNFVFIAEGGPARLSWPELVN